MVRVNLYVDINNDILSSSSFKYFLVFWTYTLFAIYRTLLLQQDTVKRTGNEMLQTIYTQICFTTKGLLKSVASNT